MAGRYPENGIVLLPDEFTWPLGVTWNPNAENYNANYFNKKVWAMMEANGAVFLTAAGQLEGATFWGTLEKNRNTLGSYWINEKFQDEKGNWFIYQVNFGADAGIQTPTKGGALPPSYGASVRLVKDTTPSGVNKVTGDKADDCQKTVKRLINGNIVIESNGILYNTVGQKISK